MSAVCVVGGLLWDPWRISTTDRTKWRHGSSRITGAVAHGLPAARTSAPRERGNAEPENGVPDLIGSPAKSKRRAHQPEVEATFLVAALAALAATLRWAAAGERILRRGMAHRSVFSRKILYSPWARRRRSASW